MIEIERFNLPDQDTTLVRLKAYLSKTLAEAQEWVIQRYLEENPEYDIDDIELVNTNFNPFAYYVRPLRENDEQIK